MLAKLLDAVRGHKYELTVTFEHPLTLKQVYFVQEVVNGVNLRSKMSYGIYENHLLDEVLKYSVDWILSVDFGSTHRESSKCGLYTWLMYKKKHRSKRVSNSNEQANNNNKTDMISNNKEDGDDKVADETTNGFDEAKEQVANGVDDDEYEEVASSVDDVEDQDVAISFHDAEEQVGANDVDYEEQEVANSFHDAEEQIGYNGVDDKEERDVDNGVDDEKEQIVTNGVDDEEEQEVDNCIDYKKEQQVANNVNDAERQGVAIGYDYADDQEVANSVDNEQKQEVANHVDDEVEKHVANYVDDKEQDIANNVDDAEKQELADSVDDKEEQVEIDDGKLDAEFDDEVSDTYNAVTDLRFDSDDSDGATKCDDANSIEVSDVTDSVIKSSPEIKKVSIQAVIKDEKNKIALPKFVCLAPESYPMDEVNFHIIQTMQNLICDKIEKNDEKPHIECVGVKNGAIIYGCHNEDGVRLIQTVAKEVGLELTNITKLYKDKKRYTVNARLNSWLDINLNKLYEFLEEYNTGLKTENWVMTDIKKNVGNIEMIIQIDENSFEFLSQNGFRLFAGVDMVRFGVIWN